LYVAGPTVFWFLLCLWFDRKRPEPAYQLLRTFLSGCLLATILVYIAGPISSLVKKIFINQPILKIFILSFLVDALIEESTKISLFNFKIYRLKSFDEPIDGIVYGMVLGLGFAFVENIFYGLVVSSFSLSPNLLLLRGVTTTFMHFLAGGIIGFYFGLAKFTLLPSKTDPNRDFLTGFIVPARKSRLIWQGFVLALLFHGLYNTITRFSFNWAILPLAILLIIVYFNILKALRRLARICPVKYSPKQGPVRHRNLTE